jgi:ATP-dependent DNA helicase DinG
MLAADVLVLNHTLFFTLLGGQEEEPKGGVLLKNDFVIFDEAHTVERVASGHIGIGVSHAQVRYGLQRLWHPNQKGTPDRFAPRQGKVGGRRVEGGGESFSPPSSRPATRSPPPAKPAGRPMVGEVRVRHCDLVQDNLTLAIQRVREEVSALIKIVNDKDTAQELTECNRRLEELRAEIAVFLSQGAPGHVYWVERTGKTQRNLACTPRPSTWPIFCANDCSARKLPWS